MRIFEFHLPVAPERYHASASLMHNTLRHTLAENWGGYNVSKAFGGWVDEEDCLHEEEVYVYRVAYETSGFPSMLDLVKYYAFERCHELAVYTVTDGTAEIVLNPEIDAR